MESTTEEVERGHLEHVKAKLREKLDRLDGRVHRYAQDVAEQKAYMWDHRTDMDHVEKVSARESALLTMLTADTVVAAADRIRKLLHSPYFGRVDFRQGDDAEPLPVYVGVHSFFDEANRQHLVFDWRAPISSLFYDHELGAARYSSPAGPVHGDISLKRQYRIRDGRLEFVLESGLNIVDDVLQQELSRTSDDRMRNIVATIQRDQNAIIRNEEAAVLIIQGVAGSGKTSVALHRIAFLLYRFKDSLASKDVLIISPNKIFADFISNVLPELGEEQVAEVEMEALAKDLLGSDVTFQNASEQASVLIENSDAALRRRIEEKSSPEFLATIDRFVEHVRRSRFRAEDIELGGEIVSAEFLANGFDRRRNQPFSDFLRWAVDAVARDLWARCRHEITRDERNQLRSRLRKMHRDPTVKRLYKDLFTWMERPELFRLRPQGVLEYADVFPMIFLGMRLGKLEGRQRNVKHLVIDEMQDYTPVQYAVIAKLFPCNKTILGDQNQAITGFRSSTAEAIRGVLGAADCVKLRTSYRSSWEITRFAQHISANADLVAVERHGSKPRVLRCNSREDELRRIHDAIVRFGDDDHNTMAVICKTQGQAVELHDALAPQTPGVQLLTSKSTAFRQGVVVLPVHLAKGLEFDRVVVAGASADAYSSELERNLLYVACTRAMHELLVTHVGPRTPFVSDADLFETE